MLLVDIAGLEDTKLICGTIAAAKKGKPGKAGKVCCSTVVYPIVFPIHIEHLRTFNSCVPVSSDAASAVGLSWSSLSW